MNPCKTTSTCPHCGTQFEHYKSQPQRCCSAKCAYASRISKKQVTKCARRGCRNTFLPQVKRGKVQRFCSLYCRHPRKP